MAKLAGLLLDVEGVLVSDKRYRAVPGAVERVNALRDGNIPMRLITNNTTDDRPAIIEKLSRAGYDFTIDELHTCTRAAIDLLREKAAQRVLVLGSEALRRMFDQTGFAVSEVAEVDAVVVGLDSHLTYFRLALACAAVREHGAPLIALHRNRMYTNEEGEIVPSVGPLVAAIEYATGVTATVMGKPSARYYEQVLSDLGVTAASAGIVSDDPFSDLAGAKRLGLETALVLSGKYPQASVVNELPADERPDAIAEDLDALFAKHGWAAAFGLT